MNENLKFEIKAEAFHRMTGMLAPGKNSCQGEAAWEAWTQKYRGVVEAMFVAVEYYKDYIS